METRLSNILKTTNTTKFIKTILESTYKVVLGKYDVCMYVFFILIWRVIALYKNIQSI